MLSDLSPGDKLSLKGKIFELQKKLQIIDIRNRQKEEFSYKPTLYNYDLPNRDNNVLDSINKAEIIRKKDMLQAAVLMQSEEGCTFAPVITNKSKRMSKQDSRPVHLRLTEKGKMYNESIEHLRTKMGKYDDSGRKLFTPAINKDSSGTGTSSAKLNTSTESGSHVPEHMKGAPSDGPDSSDERGVQGELEISGLSERQSVAHTAAPTAAADEFLYQDARDREERFRLREREQQAEIEAKAAATKMNSSSITLLRRKAERDAKLAFRSIVQVPPEQDDCDAIFGIDDVQRTAQSVYNVSKWADEALNTHISTVFSLLDHKQDGSVGRSHFLAAAAPLLLHSSVGGAMQEFSSRAGTAGAGEQGAELSVLCKASPEELGHLQSFLRKVVEHAQVSTANPGAVNAFKPHIYQHSYKLAHRKERKERERIEEVLAASKAKSALAQHSQQALGEGNEDAGADEGDDLPPPPPPAGAGADFGDANDAHNDHHSDLVQRKLNESGDSVSLGGANALNHHDIMYARALLKQQNLQRIAEEVAAREMKECTFRPKLIPPMPLPPRSNGESGRNGDRAGRPVDASGLGDGLRLQDLEPAQHAEGDDGVSLLSEPLVQADQGASPAPQPQPQEPKSVHERLYNLKDKKKSSKLAEPSKRMVEEMQACTFAPQMRSSFFHKGDVSTIAPVPPTEKSTQGALKSVERMRRAHEAKVRKAAEESHEHQAELLNQSYARSREVARQGVVPFKFVLNERLEPKPDKVLSPSKRTDPDLIVDVKLSALKTAKISIWRGDDPFTLASSFARVYSLDTKARDLLVTVIHQSMEQNGLIVAPAPDLPEPLREASRVMGRSSSGYVGDAAPGGADDPYGGEVLEGDEEYYSESSVSGSNNGEENQSDISDEGSISSNTEQSELESENLTA